MAIEFDDRELKLIGNNARHVGFYDNSRQLRASIYLDENNNLNIGGLQLSTASNDEGGGLDLADVPFLAIAATPLLNNERVLAAGDGLRATDQGGGNNFTLRVEAADLAGNGLEASSNNLALQTPGTLSQSSANSASGNHTHAVTTSSNPGANARILASTAAGALTLQQLNVDNVRLDGNTLSAQSGDLTLTAADGDVVLPSAINIGADNFASQLTGWRVTYAGNADFRNIYADELHVKAFIADIEQALAGGQIISKSVALLSRDFRIPLRRSVLAVDATNDFFVITGTLASAIETGQSFVVTGSTGNDGTYTVASVTEVNGNTRIFTNQDITNGTADGVIKFRQTLYVEDLPGFENTGVFANSDWIRLRVIDRSGGGLVVADAWGQVFTYTDLSGGEQSWVFRAEDDGSVPGNTVHAGAVALDYGASGDGWHEITALDSDGPYSQIVTWATDPTNSSNYTLRTRLGNLDGVTDSDFPSIGGWGLYSTNVFLKGVVEAASGAVVLDTNGIVLNGQLGSDTPSQIHWTDGEGGDTVMRVGVVYDPNTEISHGEITLLDTGAELTARADSIELIADTRINLAGDTLIGGTGTPGFRLDVRADASGFAASIFNDGNAATRHGLLIDAGQDSNPTVEFIRFRDGDGTVVGRIFGDGSGGVTYASTSDERRKQDIEPLDDALGKVLALEPVTYRGRGAARSAPKRAGLVAQRVQGVLPDLVTEVEGLLSLDYMGVTPYLIGAVQELAARLEKLEAR